MNRTPNQLPVEPVPTAGRQAEATLRQQHEMSSFSLTSIEDAARRDRRPWRHLRSVIAGSSRQPRMPS
jgi:hypothetical protein